MTTAAVEASFAAEFLSDDQLMAGLNAGDVDSTLTALKERYAGRIHRLVNNIVRDRHLAEDVAQEVFVKVFSRSHLYRPGSNFRAWLFHIARNQALGAIRSRRTNPQPMGSLETSREQVSSAVQLEALCGGYEDQTLREREFMVLLTKSVGRLPDDYRRVFQLCVQEGRKYREAARMLGIPTGTVAIRLQRARRQLFRDLSRHMGRIRRPPACMQSN